ncbi:MAG: hypothetical protein IKU04_02680 [Bacteroidales bacterium]|nr:hypothetical protein [Bacteroidales bacterium]MBR5704263.1 hypothetical protein [Bacteroidales bacterium]
MKRTLKYLLAALAIASLVLVSCKKHEEDEPVDENVVATLTQAELVDAVAGMYAAWEENTTIAESLKVGSKDLTLPQYQYAMFKLLVNLQANDKADVKVLDLKAADHPERDSYDKDEIAVVNGPANAKGKEDLASIAQRILDEAVEKVRIPNVTLFDRTDGSISFSTNRATVTVARAIAGYKKDGKLPEKVSTEYLSAGSTLMGFAKEFVKILDVWQAHVGTIESDGAHSVDSKNEWKDVHYIPTHTTTYPNSAENSEPETTITVADQTYDMEQCWTIAAQGIVNMITLEGMALVPTVQNVREHTLGDGVGLNAPIPTAPEMIPWQHPFYEYAGLLNLSSKNPWKVEYFGIVLPWWYNKSTLGNGRVTNFASIGSWGIEGVSGELSAMRMLLMMARFYKYLLDNNITKDVYTATKGLIIDHDLYGVKPADIILQTGEEMTFEAEPPAGVSIKFAANTAWTATASEAWIHLDPASGDIENPATITVTVDNNTGDAREGTVSIKGTNDEATVVSIKQLAYVAPSGATLKDFAQQLVTVLDVWKANVGTIQPDGQHQGDKRFFNVHYIPTWSNYGADVTDNVSQPETTITVGTETYTMYEAWVVAAKGIVEILTKEGMECVPDEQATLKHTLGGGKGLDIPVPAKNATWNKWAYPWYEDGDLNLSADKPYTVEMMAQMMPWWLKRAQTLDSGKGRINNYQILGDYKFAGGQTGMMSAMRMYLIMIRFYKHLLDNNIESNIYEAVQGMTIDYDLYGEGIPAESQSDMKAFAKQFVTLLDVWDKNVGTIYSDGKHQGENAWKNVHFIPVYSAYEDSDNNKQDEATITVNGKTYKPFEAWDIAIKGFVEMCTAEGTTVWPTALNTPVHTLANGKPMTMEIPELEADKWNKCKYPWYQNEGAANFDADHPVNIEVLRRVLPYWLNRARQLDSGTGRIGNYLDMASSGLDGYKGEICPMQSLLILLRIYKYLLDNNITENVYDAIKDKTWDPELWGAEPEPVFADDFEWMASYSAATNAPDDVTNDTVGSSPNIFTKTELANLLTELQTRGYGYVWGWKDQPWSDGTPDNGNKQTLYLNKNYLKFGKTSYSSGLILPALSALTEAKDVTLTFDWCWCKTGSNNPDLMTLTVTVSGGGTIEATGTETSGEIESGQSKENPTKLEWQHASVKIKGATSTTRITIRPTNNDPDVSNSARHQNRWYLDNIAVK